MSVPLDEVLRTLRTFPSGATTRQLAERMGMKRANLGGRLSKAYCYGLGVDREMQTVADSRGRYDQFIWSVK